MNQPLTAADQALLIRLGEVAGAVDPVPDHVLELGRAALALRDLDSELAELVADSAVELAGVRSGSTETRLLSFEAGDLAVDVQVSTAGGGRMSILGQVVPVPAPAGGVIRLESQSGAMATSDLDSLGDFRFGIVPDGLIRLRVELPGATAVTTTWIDL